MATSHSIYPISREKAVVSAMTKYVEATQLEKTALEGRSPRRMAGGISAAVREFEAAGRKAAEAAKELRGLMDRPGVPAQLFDLAFQDALRIGISSYVWAADFAKTGTTFKPAKDFIAEAQRLKYDYSFMEHLVEGGPGLVERLKVLKSFLDGQQETDSWSDYVARVRAGVRDRV